MRSAGGSSRNMECGGGAAAPLTYFPESVFFFGGSRNTPRVLSVCAGAFRRGPVASRHGACIFLPEVRVFSSRARRASRRVASSGFSHSARSRAFASKVPILLSFRTRASKGLGNTSVSPPRLSEASDLVRSSVPPGKNALAKYFVGKCSPAGSSQGCASSSSRLCGRRFAAGTRLAAASCAAGHVNGASCVRPHAGVGGGTGFVDAVACRRAVSSSDSNASRGGRRTFHSAHASRFAAPLVSAKRSMVDWCTSACTSRALRYARLRARLARYAEFSIVRGGWFLTRIDADGGASEENVSSLSFFSSPRASSSSDG